MKKNKAFTLIESIIVMVILGLSLSGATFLMMTVTESIAENRQRISATYLTQECMELARNLRDSSWKQNLPWDCAFENLGGDLENDSVFRVSVDPNSLPNIFGNQQSYCRNDLGINLERDPVDFIIKNNAMFDHEPGSDTIFDRKLTITEVHLNAKGENDSAKFTCEVSWENKGNPKKIRMSQILTNWRK